MKSALTAKLLQRLAIGGQDVLMAEINRAVRGTMDVTPADSYKWQYIERVIADTAKLYGYSEIRIPVFEYTEVFRRSVGETTDVVQKEMYTFDDMGGRSITLRPEGTAGVVRAFLENGLHNEPMPQKLYYILSCYRYEKPQSGRLREFHQFGCECFGAALPRADAEIIKLVNDVITRLGVKDYVSLELNSIGCKKCRADFLEALKKYYEPYKSELCETCLDRLERNPMRLLDCKSPVCSAIAAGAPDITDYLCKECAEHFEGVKSALDAYGIDYKINPKIVRGLDYYNRTVFEFVTDKLGAQATVSGGGRYDGLVEQMNGPSMPALGFGMGLERMIMLMENVGAPFPQRDVCDIYIGSAGSGAEAKAAQIADYLRSIGIYAVTDIVGRSVKAQMKYAGRLGARYTAIIGDSELESGYVNVKNMESGETVQVSLDEKSVLAAIKQ